LLLRLLRANLASRISHLVPGRAGGSERENQPGEYAVIPVIDVVLFQLVLVRDMHGEIVDAEDDADRSAEGVTGVDPRAERPTCDVTDRQIHGLHRRRQRPPAVDVEVELHPEQRQRRDQGPCLLVDTGIGVIVDEPFAFRPNPGVEVEGIDPDLSENPNVIIREEPITVRNIEVVGVDPDIQGRVGDLEVAEVIFSTSRSAESRRNFVAPMERKWRSPRVTNIVNIGTSCLSGRSSCPSGSRKKPLPVSLFRNLKLESKRTEEPPTAITNCLLLDCRIVSVGSSAEAAAAPPRRHNTIQKSSFFIVGPFAFAIIQLLN